MYTGDKQHRAIMRLENTEENVNVPNPPTPFPPSRKEGIRTARAA